MDKLSHFGEEPAEEYLGRQKQLWEERLSENGSPDVLVAKQEGVLYAGYLSVRYEGEKKIPEIVASPKFSIKDIAGALLERAGIVYQPA